MGIKFKFIPDNSDDRRIMLERYIRDRNIIADTRIYSTLFSHRSNRVEFKYEIDALAAKLALPFLQDPEAPYDPNAI